MNLKKQASELMKQKIIQVSIDILGSEGYSSFTVGKLSKQAGISKGALYHHFENFEQLRLAVLQAMIDQLIYVDDVHRYRNLKHYFVETGEALFQVLDAQPIMMKALYAFTTQALFDSQIKLQLQQLIQHSLSDYERVIEHFEPTIKPSDRTLLILMLDAYFGGAAMHWYLLDQPKKCKQSWQIFCEGFLLLINAKRKGNK